MLTVSGMFVEYHPISSFTNGAPIEFEVSSSGDDYIDFANSYLYVRVRVVNPGIPDDLGIVKSRDLNFRFS
jgi:hypothetical protein